jgi:hypothetical protein
MKYVGEYTNWARPNIQDIYRPARLAKGGGDISEQRVNLLVALRVRGSITPTEPASI